MTEKKPDDMVLLEYVHQVELVLKELDDCTWRRLANVREMGESVLEIAERMRNYRINMELDQWK